MKPTFTKAVRKKAKLRCLLTGPSGSGKTYSALMLAMGLGAKRIALIDTEHGSASLYAHLCDFDVLELAPPFTPERFIEAIEAAGEGGYDACIIDSTTHEWSGVGGCLEIVDAVSKTMRGNSYMAWGDVTPRHRAFLDAMLRAPMHIIATGRSKTETAQVEEGGKKRVVKLGMKTEQRDGLEYEFTLALDLTHDGNLAVATKDRTGLFAGRDPERITLATGQRLLAWLDTGADAQAELLGELRNAAMAGTDALIATYNAAKTRQGFKTLWAAEGEALKRAATLADAQQGPGDEPPADNTAPDDDTARDEAPPTDDGPPATDDGSPANPGIDEPTLYGFLAALKGAKTIAEAGRIKAKARAACEAAGDRDAFARVSAAHRDALSRMGSKAQEATA